MTTTVVKLSKGLATHQGTVNELKFGPLTAEIMIRNKKLPFTVRTQVDGTREVDTDFAVAAKYIADLTGHDEMIIGSLPIKDFGACCNMLGEILRDAGN